MKREMATIHFMHGFIGFGKTTVAKKLADDFSAVRLNSDEWMVKLYGQNPPAEHFKDYLNRIKELHWQLIEQLIKAGVDVIQEDGGWSKEGRAENVARAKMITDNIVFHSVQCSLETAKKRTLQRNANEGQLYIEENTFNMCLRNFEPILEAEGYKIIYHDGEPLERERR